MRRFMRNYAEIAAFADAARRALCKAWCIILFERFWRRFTPLLLVMMAFAVFCWLNIFVLSPFFIHVFLLFAFAGAFIAACLFLYFLRPPTRAEAQARLERDNHLHYGQMGLGEQQLAENSPPEAKALWREHKRRMQRRIGPLRSRAPRPNIPVYDRNGLRAPVFLVFVIAFCFQLGGSGGRLSDAFYFGAWQPADAIRIDAWINPPDYTGRPPVYLLSGNNAADGSGNNAASGDAGIDESNAASAPITVPQGSRLTLRVNDNGRGLARLYCTLQSGKTRLRPQSEGASSVYHMQLMQSAHCVLSAPGLHKNWSIAVEADKAPIIIWAKPPERALNGMLKLNYTIYDDYGIKKAWAEIKPADENTQTNSAYPYFARLTGTAAESRYKGGKFTALQGVELKNTDIKPPQPEALFTAPQISLNLPRPLPDENTALRGGEAATEADLTKNPWAGAAVTMRLWAEDAAGHKTASALMHLVLPQRTFVNPLSRALIEQRRLLTENIYAVPRIADMLNALLLWPEKTIADKAAALALYSLRARLKLVPPVKTAEQIQAENRNSTPQQIAQIRNAEMQARQQSLRDVAAYMWAIAAGIDGGKLAEAERRLKQASQALRDALRNGASREELARLMQNLRDAMQDYIAMLAERGQAPDSGNGPAKMLGEGDLEKRLKALEEAAKKGDRGLGEQLLSEFEDLMKNLQVTQGSGGDGATGGKNSKQSQMQKQMDTLSDIMRRQQQLLDDTHKLQEQNLHGQNDDAPARDGQSEGNKQAHDKQGQNNKQTQDGRAPDKQTQDGQRQALQERQGALQKSLQDLQKQLGAQGLSPKDNFKGAEQQMDNSEQALQQGDVRQALKNQSQALQALRDNAQNVMGQMREALQAADAARQAQKGGQSESESQGEDKRGRRSQDPLGRPSGTGQAGADDFMPQEDLAQRARRILEEIRKKLGNLTPQQEKEYLERLLNFDK